MKKNKKCLVVGKFAYKSNVLDGQTVKCKTIYTELINKYGNNQVSMIDTYNWKKRPIKLFRDIINGVMKHEAVIIMPAHNGIRVFGPLFSFLKCITKTKVYYIVIGSWLFDKVQKSQYLKNKLKKYDKIFVETSLLKKNLEQVGFYNVAILKNYKKLNVIKNILPYKEKKVLKVCIFSRVNAEKGILDAINTIKEVNKLSEKVTLDIFGMIDEKFKKDFNEALKLNKKIVHYKGVINPSNSVDVIKKYDILLFPTKYYTEGIPGTIIDSYAAGVPVLASKWQNYEDVIDDGKTGLVFEFNDMSDFKEKIEYIYINQQIIHKMKFNCIKKAVLYCGSNVLQPLFEELGE